MLEKKFLFKKFTFVLAAAVMLAAVPTVFADDSDAQTVTNNALYSDVASVWGGSVLISADVKAESGTSASIRVLAENNSEIADVSIDSVLSASDYTTVNLLIHKNGTYQLYKGNKLEESGKINGGADKAIKKVGILSNGTLNYKNLAVSDYMDTSDKTDVLFESDFSAMTMNANVASGTPDGFYCDDWYASDSTKTSGSDYYCDIQGTASDLYMRYIDTKGGQSVRHMIKNGGMSDSFEISTKLLFPHWNNRYDGGFRMFLVDESGKTVDLIKAGTKEDSAVERGAIPIYDGNGEKLFDVRGQTWTDITIKVDLNSQMYTVSYSESAGSSTSAPISLPNMKNASPYAMNLVNAVGIAKDVASTGSISFKNFAVKEKKDNSIGVLFEDNFNSGVSNWSFNKDYSNHTPVNFTSETYKGHKAMKVERSEAKNIEDASKEKTVGNTYYGTIDEAGLFTQDTAGRKTYDGTNATWATNSAVIYHTLDEAIDTTKDVYVEFDAHMGNKSWRYNGITDEKESYSPRDTLIVSLGTSTSKADASDRSYMEYTYSANGIQESINGNTTVGNTMMPVLQSFDISKNGPYKNWISAGINNNACSSITVSTSGISEKAAGQTLNQVASANTIAFTIGNYHGGACYIDNVKIYTKDASVKEVTDISAQAKQAIAVNFTNPTEKFVIENTDGLSAGAAMNKISVSNYSGSLSQNAFAVAALYNKSSKILTNCMAESVTLSKVNNTIEFTSPITLPSDFSKDKYELKVFLFDGTDTLKPLSVEKDCLAD